MKQTLQVRLSQHLALTPQLQQSIRLLQLSTLELHQEVEQMLATNPLLDTEDEFFVSAPELTPNAPPESSGEAAGESDSGDANDTPELKAEDFGGTEREDWENGTERDDFDGIRELPSNSGTGTGSGDDGERESQEFAETSLAEHLVQQLAGMSLTPEDRAAVQVLIESLNEDGYLEDSLDDIAASLAEDPEDQEELLDHLRVALCLLQSLEPGGIAARDLSECLTLQLRSAPPCAALPVAVLVCK
ncbi:RNA polymerase factor sigma-54, partial [Pelomonas sp. HMWF004]